MPPIIRTTIIAALVAFTLPASASPLSGNDPVISTGTVYRTIDGDTFMVNIANDAAYRRIKTQARGDSARMSYLKDRYNSIRVRLASVDTPESVHPDADLNTEAGKETSVMMKKLTEGKAAKVACYDWGFHGRLICNLGIKDDSGWADIGGWLIEHGISPYVTDFGNNPFYHTEYQQLEASAP